MKRSNPRLPLRNDQIYVFAWGNNEVRAMVKGRKCRVLERGGKGTVLVEFLDSGFKMTTSFRALRRVEAVSSSKGFRASREALGA